SSTAAQRAKPASSTAVGPAPAAWAVCAATTCTWKCARKLVGNASIAVPPRPSATRRTPPANHPCAAEPCPNSTAWALTCSAAGRIELAGPTSASARARASPATPAPAPAWLRRDEPGLSRNGGVSGYARAGRGDAGGSGQIEDWGPAEDFSD